VVFSKNGQKKVPRVVKNGAPPGKGAGDFWPGGGGGGGWNLSIAPIGIARRMIMAIVTSPGVFVGL